MSRLRLVHRHGSVRAFCALLSLTVLLPGASLASGAGRATHASVLSATAFGATNGGAPFAGDGRLLTTISPNGDDLRDRATIHFTLSQAATATLEIRQAQPPREVVFRHTARLRAGPGVLVWAPSGIRAGTYLVRLALDDKSDHRLAYTTRRTNGRSSGTPIVRVLGIEAAFTSESVRPDSVAALEIMTDAPSLSLQVFRSGPETTPIRNGVLSGIAMSRLVHVGWRAHPDGPARIRVRIGDWPTGVYYVRLGARDGRVGYAPLVIRPAQLGEHRVAVVMPTNTWQAYNFRDEDGNGAGDTWYAQCASCTVRLGRAYLDDGVPPHYRRYDLPFLHWLASTNRPVDYLTDSDLEDVATGSELARAYDLIVFPGHHEYVTEHEYDVITRYRDLGGNLAFLSANNFFWRVDRHGRVIERVAQWRKLGRPEAALIGVQYRANDRGERKAGFVVRSTAAAPWLFARTGLTVGSTFTGYGYPTGPFGIEIDATTASSPEGTKILAEIPNLYGPGFTAQMTYYETPAGAKVFAAGAFTLGGAALWQPVTRLLDNLWNQLAHP